MVLTALYRKLVRSAHGFFGFSGEIVEGGHCGDKVLRSGRGCSEKFGYFVRGDEESRRYSRADADKIASEGNRSAPRPYVRQGCVDASVVDARDDSGRGRTVGTYRKRCLPEL